jgi:hypothetical protein
MAESWDKKYILKIRDNRDFRQYEKGEKGSKECKR